MPVPHAQPLTYGIAHDAIRLVEANEQDRSRQWEMARLIHPVQFPVLPAMLPRT
jgi:hypothetical protein